jgi:hypothetical protein
VQRLIADMATHNHTWGDERIAAELRVKLGLTVSPRTVRRYMPLRPQGRGRRSTRSWATFLHNHAGAVLACDFFIVVTATFQRLYVFVLLDIGSRPNCALESHRPPQIGMDDPAVPKRPASGWHVSPSLSIAGFYPLTAGPAFCCLVLAGSTSCLGGSVLELFSTPLHRPTSGRPMG